MKFEYPPPGHVDRASWWFVGYVCGLACAAAWMILGGGCAARQEQVGSRVIPVAITAWPSPIRSTCELSDLPPVPDVFLWQHVGDSEETGRYYVTQRQLADLVAWHKDVKHWGDLIYKCLDKLTDREAP